jgi:hypothetical protein
LKQRRGAEGKQKSEKLTSGEGELSGETEPSTEPVGAAILVQRMMRSPLVSQSVSLQSSFNCFVENFIGAFSILFVRLETRFEICVRSAMLITSALLFRVTSGIAEWL